MPTKWKANLADAYKPDRFHHVLSRCRAVCLFKFDRGERVVLSHGRPSRARRERTVDGCGDDEGAGGASRARQQWPTTSIFPPTPINGALASGEIGRAHV